MIRAKFETTFTANHPLVQLPKQFEDLAYEAGNEAFMEIREPTLRILQIYPPERPNQTYVRTYKLQRGWKMGIRRLQRNRFEIEVSNNTEYTSFVVGSLDQAVTVAASFQADIHKGRWNLATTTVSVAFGDFLKAYDDKLADKLKGFGTITRRQIR